MMQVKKKETTCDLCKKEVNQFLYYNNLFLCVSCFFKKWKNPTPGDVIGFDKHVNGHWIVTNFIPEHFQKEA